jgi:UDP-glucose 4-epimerase
LGVGFSVLEIIDACNLITQKKIELKYANNRDGDPPTLVADNQKIKSVLNWDPEYTCIKEIIKTAWKWHSKKHVQYSTL